MIDQSNVAPVDTRDRIIETARQLFFEHGYASTSIAQIRTASRTNSGSLYHFFPSKEHLLVAVLEKYKTTLSPEIFEPAYVQASEPIERLFAILEGYRKLLRSTNFRLGCPMGSLAMEVSNDHPDVRRQIVANFETLRGAIEKLLQEASGQLPAKTEPATLARHVLATMEGGLMLARSYRSVEPFDQAVNHLKDYFDRLQKDRAEFEFRKRVEVRVKEIGSQVTRP